MNYLITALVLLSLSACSNSTDSEGNNENDDDKITDTFPDKTKEEPSLVGYWSIQSTARQCTVLLVFSDNAEMNENTICTLTNGTYGVMIRLYDYSATDESIEITKTHSSCPDEETETEIIVYELKNEGDTLTLVTLEGAMTLKRTAESDDESTSVVQFGCFDEEGFFTPNEVKEL